MKLFLDSSVLIAASGSIKGSAYAIVRRYAKKNHWILLTSPYCLAEVEKNILKLSAEAQTRWQTEIRERLTLTEDVLTMQGPHLLTASKDKPVLISAISAHVKVLLTHDSADFHSVLNTSVYGVEILTPPNFLMDQRKRNLLHEP